MEVKRGTCILREKPFVYALKSKYRTERCDFCFVENELLKCSNCMYVYYCNRRCQKDAWPIHKRECPLISKVSSRTIPDAARMLVRLILKLNNGGDFEKAYYSKKNYRKFKDLMSHSPNIKANVKRMEHIKSLYMVLSQMMSECFLPNESEFLCIYGKFIINSFNILDLDMNSIGTGIYLGASIADHSCTPNTVATFEGTTISFHLIEDLPKLDWSKIFISYIDLLNLKEIRIADLEENYFFLCQCTRCQDSLESMEMNAISCTNINCKESINLEHRKCSHCNTSIPVDYMDNYNEIVEFTKTQLNQMKDIAYVDICKIMLDKQKLLYTTNIWYIKTLEIAFESAVNVGKWDFAIECGIKLVDGLRKYCGNYNPILGIAYVKLGKILLNENSFHQAFNYLKEACQIISITHGQQHSLYKLRLLPLLMDAAAHI